MVDHQHYSCWLYALQASCASLNTIQVSVNEKAVRNLDTLTLQDMHLGCISFAGALKCGAIQEVEKNTIWQFLLVLIRSIR
jgi:hypothetical protein